MALNTLVPPGSRSSGSDHADVTSSGHVELGQRWLVIPVDTLGRYVGRCQPVMSCEVTLDRYGWSMLAPVPVRVVVGHYAYRFFLLDGNGSNHLVHTYVRICSGLLA